MIIKHLVLAGGGPLGFKYLGALQKLHDEDYWNRENIKSIYGTSVGTIIGAFICLNHDWDTLNKYIIDRPWHDAFKLKPKQLFDVYYNKGLYDETMFEILFKPLLKSKDLDTTITLQQFYDYSNIDLHLFTFDLNTFKVLELSHASHPKLSLIKAITMSCALPGIVMPIFMDGGCYIDGGILLNYPLNSCIRDNQNSAEILGINRNYSEHPHTIIQEDSSILEYIVGLTMNSITYIGEMSNKEIIENELVIIDDIQALSPETLKSVIGDAVMRAKLIQDGETVALQYLKQKQTHKQNTNKETSLDLEHGI